MKNKQIEAFRGIGMFIIVIFHYYYRFQELYMASPASIMGIEYWGSIGVGLFFIITGCFLIPLERKNFNLFEYYFKRFKTLYPSYFFAVILIYVSTNLFGLKGRISTIKDLVLNIFLINGYIGTRYVDGAHWYLTFLLVFIVISGLLKHFNLDNSIFSYLIWIMASFLLHSICEQNISPKPILSGLKILSGGEYTPYIVIGISLRKLKEKIQEKTIIKIQWQSLIVIAIVLIFAGQGLYICLGTLMISVLIYLALNKYLKIFDIALSEKIGAVSYIIYLIHQNIGYQMIVFETNYFSFSFASIIIPMIIVVLMGIIIHKCWEIPIHNLLDTVKFNIFSRFCQYIKG